MHCQWCSLMTELEKAKGMTGSLLVPGAAWVPLYETGPGGHTIMHFQGLRTSSSHDEGTPEFITFYS